MALYDNKYWLLSHIRNSFISTDDTGMCELVMSGETKDIQHHLKTTELYPDPETSEDDEDDFEPFDLQIDMDFNIRERSNTAAQIEKLELARKKAAKMRHIKWESSGQPINSNNFDDLFVKKDVTTVTKPKTNISKLSELIQCHSDVPKNPYMEYAKFDGTGQVNIPTKKYKIFLTMLPPQQRNYPMAVCCVAQAKVQELIGLTLLKLSYSHGTANLKSPSQYGLYITEEDGEVDSDFPCLDPKEPISKFGFICLGLVEHKDAGKSVSFPEDNSVLFTIEELNRTRTVSEKSKTDENKQMENYIQAVEDHNKLMEAPLYTSFRAFLMSKVKPKIEVNIGVSGERIEIDPVPQKGSKLLPFKAKAISHSIDSIASCEITDDKASKTGFRIIYRSSMVNGPIVEGTVSEATNYSPSQSTSYKHYDFESNHNIAVDLVQKIKLILELKSSPTRIEYLATKQRKNQKKKSFHIVK
ncbi:stress-activated map kinase-interacting protein 1 isoform X1 [Diabrotica virgifera virgifera]|uniref:Target of rapamycin complex 2 subunit MAPKAP1 n=2 Tax=Diabrotica virgifera virgifera TaxID=50390 RepID=A0ABM5KM84_DIAVI|nr:stress-activated map kinase-interacting protein 1 isoform X1 [Diabrotica virgifera virgifera]